MDRTDRTQCGIQHFIGARERAEVGGVNFGGLGEDVAGGQCSRAIAVLAVIPQQKNSAGLRGLLVDVGKLVVAIASQELDAD